jgi:uncharacterized protein YaaN involved in tellurite resistance
MERFLDIAVQVPALAVLAFVWLKYMQQQKTVTVQCHRLQERTLDCLNKNTQMLGSVSVLLGKLNGRSCPYLEGKKETK